MTNATKPDDSSITHHNGGTTIVGKDAMNFYRAAHLKAALSLFAKTGLIPTRGVSGTRLLAMASEYTKKHYKRGQHLEAVADMQVWIDTMKCALPIIDERRPPRIPVEELSFARMAAGNENKFLKVIRDGKVREWVGIGWVEIRDPTPDDYNTIPESEE